jgi:hypothetical protein
MEYSPMQAGRRIAAMEAAFEDANVTGYERLVDSMTNDPKDRHVVAAAIRCAAHLIVTENLKHVPPGAVKPFGLDEIHPDEFLLWQIHVNREPLLEKLAAQAEACGMSYARLLDRLERHAPRSVQRLRA